jgi:hypothetical protein
MPYAIFINMYMHSNKERIYKGPMNELNIMYTIQVPQNNFILCNLKMHFHIEKVIF